MATYTELADHFRRQIEDGTLPPGTKLPTVREVAQAHGVAQKTAVRAYKQLKLEGLTTATTGGGTVVAEPGSSSAGDRNRAWLATGRALRAGEESQVLEVGTVGADEMVASRLEITPGAPVHMRRRLVSRAGAPVHLSTSYYPAYVIEVTPELTRRESTGGSRELAAQRLGATPERSLEEVTSRLATEDEKRALGLTGTVVVTQVVRTVVLSDGRLVEVAVKVCSGQTVLKWSTSLDSR